MFHAKAAALRSADLSRQIGAVIAFPEGEIVSVGCNEVPKAGGGNYWPGESNDARDFVLGYDSSARFKQEILAELIHLLKGAGWLSKERTDFEVESLIGGFDTGSTSGFLKNSQLMNILEFGRVVHAEMSALSEAARRGLSVKGASLYSTAFPCHICARHIVASGISKVIYIEPYPKSMAQRLYPEAIESSGNQDDYKVNFLPFLGVSPNQYLDLFSMVGKRKDKNGNAVQWKRVTAEPRLARIVGSYLAIETLAIGVLDEGLERSGLRPV